MGLGWVLVGACGAFAGGGTTTTTVYVGRHFEVRDYDQPVKCVFNGNTRVARITGSLSESARVQRLRLRAGWNLCAIVVDEAKLPANPAIVASFEWDPETRGFARVEAGRTLGAGSVLWLKANSDAVVSVVGNYDEPAPTAPVPGGGAFVAGPGLEVLALQLPPGVTVWKFDPATASWRTGFAEDLSPLSDLPPALAPGEAIYVHTDAPVELLTPDPALRIAYYHQDHLGSSSVVTDADGERVEETAFYPFGAIRHQERLQKFEAHYRFGQKERDAESGLQYFGQRYLHPALGRWTSTDPMRESGGGMNPYAYVNQNPLKLHDPGGTEIKVTEVVDKRTRTTTYQISLKAAFLDVSSEKFNQQQVAAFATELQSAIEKDFTGAASEKVGGKKWSYKWSTSVDLRVIKNWKEVGKGEHVFRIVDRTKGGRGETTIGGMLVNLKANIYKRSAPERSPAETGAHEFGHAAGLRHDDRTPNLMMRGDLRPEGVSDIGLEQIKQISRAYKEDRLNQREKIMDELDEIAKRR